jgi:protein phosphatase 1L
MVVLACDGVWDVMPDQRAIDLALEHWGNPQAAAAAIVRKALSAGSPDNLTAQVVMFGWKGEQGAEAAARRAEELTRQADEEAKPVTKAKVEEEDIDMFA